VLWGAIEGAAERYEEQVYIVEQTCMKRGAPVYRFVAHFALPPANQQQRFMIPEQVTRQQKQKELTQLVLDLLPESGPTEGVTLTDLQEILQLNQRSKAHQLRPAVLFRSHPASPIRRLPCQYCQ
jgi:hypothetical protein